MLWRKIWWETRWGFLPFLGLGMLAAATQRPYDLDRWVSFLEKMAPLWGVNPGRIISLLGNYDGIVWWNWFNGELFRFLPFCAVIIGATFIASCCPAVGAHGRASLFTISLPISRRKILLAYAALAAVEVFIVVLAPTLIYLIASGFAGQQFSLRKIIIHAFLLALSGMVFLALSFLLTVIFSHQWKAMAIGVIAAVSLHLSTGRFEEYPWWNIYHVMSGETYFRHGRIPWLGLFASLAISALMMFAAIRIYERRDF